MIEMLTLFNNAEDTTPATLPILAPTMTVEDGTGVVGANSYATYAVADDYAALRQWDDWADATSAQKASALVRGADYLQGRYRAQEGPLRPSQGLRWPTSGVLAVPVAVVIANVILARYALRGPLSLPSSRGIKSKTVKAGSVETATVFDDATPADPYPEITALLSDVVATGAGASVSFTKAIR